MTEQELNQKIEALALPKGEYTRFLSGYLSNWATSSFVDGKGNQFFCVEQFMMYHKAILFGDTAIASRIMKSEHPGECKRLGRQVRDFDEKTWQRYRIRVVYQGNYLKFKQNTILRQRLLTQTRDTLIVECNPSDRIWGIGKAVHDPYFLHTEEWGKNLLGKVLTLVREDIKVEFSL